LAVLPAPRAAQVAFIVSTSACWSESVKACRADVQLDSGWVHVRGTKRAARDRRILVRHPALASLLAYALEHAPGEELLFPLWSNVRRDLLAACEQAGIAPCSPNDLRRTYAKWMRLARVPAEIVAPAMGHRDTRMVERVYGCLSPEEIGALLTQHFALDCITGASNGVDSAGKHGGMDVRAAATQRQQCPGAESNHRHGDFQSPALPTELPGRETPPGSPTWKGERREGAQE